MEGEVGGATDFSFPTATVLLAIRVLCDLLCTSMAATESHRGWWSTRRPAGLVIDQQVLPQEMAGLCSSSATPRDMHSSRWVIANSLNFRHEEDDVVARISGCHHRSDVGFPMDEVQNGGGGGVNRMSDDFAAAEEAPDSRRPVMGVDDDDHAALLAAGALLDLSTSLVDEGYNTSSIGSSTGNVIKTQKPRRKQMTTQQAQVKLEPGISESNDDDDDRHGSTKRIEGEPLVADQTAKRRRMRKAWTDFETPLSVGKKRSEEESGESEKGSVITTQAETTTTITTAALLPRPTERGRKWGEDKKSVVVITEQQTSVLPRPANRKRYRPLEKLMQETPVITSVYSEED